MARPVISNLEWKVGDLENSNKILRQESLIKIGNWTIEVNMRSETLGPMHQEQPQDQIV